MTHEASQEAVNAKIWQVTRFCCRSGLCVDCHIRGNHGSLAGRKRIVHARNLKKDMADTMSANWQAFDARTELMP